MSYARSYAYFAHSTRMGLTLGGPYVGQSAATSRINQHIKWSGKAGGKGTVPGETFEVHRVDVDHIMQSAVVDVVKTVKVPE